MAEFVHQRYMTTDELKEAAERAMAGYDELPACTRHRIQNALHNVTDTAIAAQLMRSGRVSTVQLAEMLESAERRVYGEGVEKHGVAPGQKDFIVCAKLGNVSCRANILSSTTREHVTKRELFGLERLGNECSICLNK